MNQLTLTLFPKRAIFFCLSQHPQLLQCTQFSFQYEPSVISPRLEQTERQSNHFLQTVVEVMNTQVFPLLALSLSLFVSTLDGTSTTSPYPFHIIQFNFNPLN